MEINIEINNGDINLKNEVLEVIKKCKSPELYGKNFKYDINNFLVEKNVSICYVAYFHDNRSNISIVTNDGIVQFNGNLPNMAELECINNFIGSSVKYYSEYEEFIKCFHSEFDIDHEDIEEQFEDAFKDFMQDLFITIGSSSDISIDCCS